MALLPPKYLNAVVAIDPPSSPDEIDEITGQPVQPSASGFLYAYPKLGTMGKTNADFRLWLVTCKHVIEHMKGANKSEIMVRLNKSVQEEMQTFRIDLRKGRGPDWTEHSTADVAVIPTSPEDLESKELQWEIFAAGRNTLTRKKAAQAGLSEGDEVFMIGFPPGWRPGKQDYPIVRHGVLAQVRGWFSGNHNTFLLDGSGFPGNSGGPVVTKPQIMDVHESLVVNSSLLIGMVSERTFSEALRDSKETVIETADLVVVTPMDAIDETIELAMSKEVEYQ